VVVDSSVALGAKLEATTLTISVQPQALVPAVALEKSAVLVLLVLLAQ
jgi:hypothetical protein